MSKVITLTYQKLNDLHDSLFNFNKTKKMYFIKFQKSATRSVSGHVVCTNVEKRLGKIVFTRNSRVENRGQVRLGYVWFLRTGACAAEKNGKDFGFFSSARISTSLSRIESTQKKTGIRPFLRNIFSIIIWTRCTVQVGVYYIYSSVTLRFPQCVKNPK